MKRVLLFLLSFVLILPLLFAGAAYAAPEENRSDFNPVRLTTLENYAKGDYGLFFGFVVYDTRMNRYADALYGVMDESDGSSYEVFDIGGKYHYFTATIAPMYNDHGIGESYVGKIRIYGDNRLLWSDEHVTSAVSPYPVRIDVSNVHDLKFEVYAQGTAGVNGLKPMLCNPLLLMDDPGFYSGAPDEPSPEAYGQALGLQAIPAFGKGKTELFCKENAKDSRGNEYPYVLYSGMSSGKGTTYDVYDIGGQYRFFSATVGLMHADGGLRDSSVGIIRIYGDGRLLWSDEDISGTARPYDMVIFIGNVNELKIEMYGEGCKSMLANPLLIP